MVKRLNTTDYDLVPNFAIGGRGNNGTKPSQIERHKIRQRVVIRCRCGKVRKSVLRTHVNTTKLWCGICKP